MKQEAESVLPRGRERRKKDLWHKGGEFKS